MDSGAESYFRYLGGEDGGLVEIIRDYKDGLILFINRYINNINIAEELAEDVFFRLAVKKPRYEPRYAFKTWLYTIGRNRAVTELKRVKRITGNTDEQEKISVDELERSYFREERKIILHKALAKINPEYGRALYLKYFGEMDNDQISRVMKKSKRQVENLLYQAKISLRTQLEKEGFHYEEL